MFWRTGLARFQSSAATSLSLKLFIVQIISLLAEHVLTSELPSVGRASLVASAESRRAEAFSTHCNFHGIRYNSTCYCGQEYQGIECERLQLASSVSLALPATGYLADGEWRHHYFHGRRGVVGKGRAVHFYLFADAWANATAPWDGSDLKEALIANGNSGVAGLTLIVRRSRPGDELRQDATGLHTLVVDKVTNVRRHALKATIPDPGPWTWWVSVHASRSRSASVAYSLTVEYEGDSESEGVALCPKPLPGTALPCSGHGVCIEGRCFCHTGFQGDDCSLRSQVAYRPITLERSGDKGRHGAVRGHVARNGWQHFYVNSALSMRAQMLALVPARGDGAGSLKPSSPGAHEEPHHGSSAPSDGLRLYLRRSDPPTKKQFDSVAPILGTWGEPGALQETLHELAVEGGGQHSWFLSVFGGSHGGSFLLQVAAFQACGRGCGDQGSCVAGECLCRPGWTDPQCSQQAQVELLASLPVAERAPAGKLDWRFESLSVLAPPPAPSAKKATHKEASASPASSSSSAAAVPSFAAEKLASVSGLAEAGRWRGYRLSFPSGVHPAEVRVEVREHAVAGQGAATASRGSVVGDVPPSPLERIGMALWRGRGVPPSSMGGLAPDAPAVPAVATATVGASSGYGVETYTMEQVPPGCAISLSLALDWSRELVPGGRGKAGTGSQGAGENGYEWWVWLTATGTSEVGYELDVFVDELAGHCPRGVAGLPCSGRGDCRGDLCRCDAGFAGDACQHADDMASGYLPTGLSLRGALAPCQAASFHLVLPSNTRAGLASVAVVVRAWDVGGEGAQGKVGARMEGMADEGLEGMRGGSRLPPVAVFLQERAVSGDGISSDGSGEVLAATRHDPGPEGGFTHGGMFEAVIERGLPRAGVMETGSEWVIRLVGGHRGGAGSRAELAMCHRMRAPSAHGAGQAHGNVNADGGDEIVLSSEYDAAMLGWGWSSVRFTIRAVATLACPMDCAGARAEGQPGVCQNGTCACPPGWGGDDCGTLQQAAPVMQGAFYQGAPAGMWTGAASGEGMAMRPLVEWSSSWWQAAAVPTVGNLLVVMALGLAACLLVSGALLFKAPSHAAATAQPQGGRGGNGAGEEDVPDDRHYEIMGMDNWSLEPLAPATPSCSDEEPLAHHMNIGGCHVGDGHAGKRRGGLPRELSERDMVAGGAGVSVWEHAGSGHGHGHGAGEDMMAWGYASSGSSSFYDFSTQGGDDGSSRRTSYNDGVGVPAPTGDATVPQGVGSGGHPQYSSRAEYRDCCPSGGFPVGRGYGGGAAPGACHRAGDGSERGEGGLAMGYPAGPCKPMGAEFGDHHHCRGMPRPVCNNNAACGGGGAAPLPGYAGGGYAGYPPNGMLSPLLASTVHGSLDNLGHHGGGGGDGRDGAGGAWLRREVHSSNSVPSLRHAAPEDALPLRGALPMANARPFVVGGCDVRQRRAAAASSAATSATGDE
eukprot:jgi/Mesvir1/23593/Mv18282-RA.1